eukprot:CAMPEP_0202903354 /NCGR_PEP_ID=MMETSP1392-20130828/23979_1 /ASSEMBLY_ACC=CAM_ASM_000868 /TAXON_ID=225041 /ORGANISM="Chlamydomonas chlamydogama, Strain SAG 11-48b" /LENGTH=96 /DNA_ID=CAMNT_0049590489 /DNA_START=367 /DNA_END=657 /DNA_ORIENTATION=+
MIAKIIAGVMAWSLHQSVTSGEAQYQQPMSAHAHVHQGQAGGMSSGPAQSPYQAPPMDPFAAYAPPRHDGFVPAAEPPASYQPFPTSQQASVHTLP